MLAGSADDGGFASWHIQIAGRLIQVRAPSSSTFR
jgi:hypothetical protein